MTPQHPTDDERAALARWRANRADNLTCPTCKRPNALTPREAARKYQCRDCTARDEGYGFEG
jgi:ribosomal protein L37AE/L43A